MAAPITEEAWRFFEANGYLSLGRVLDDSGLDALSRRIDDIMLGTAPVDYDRLLMQIDSTTGRYEDAGAQSRGWKGATRGDRKIQNLEHDPLFGAYVERPEFREIAARVYGAGTPVACFRAMFMNKPARRGTLLPWHQDCWTDLDRQPLITAWTALDPATVANGCVEVVPGSHRRGRVNTAHASGFLTEAQAEEHCPPDRRAYLELAAGEAVLLHNRLLHRSDVNATDTPRRAFSVCYMDGRTRAAGGETFTPLFVGDEGDGQ